MYYGLIELFPTALETKAIVIVNFTTLSFSIPAKAFKKRDEPLIPYPTLHLQGRLSFLLYI